MCIGVAICICIDVYICIWKRLYDHMLDDKVIVLMNYTTIVLSGKEINIDVRDMVRMWGVVCPAVSHLHFCFKCGIEETPIFLQDTKVMLDH